METPRTVTVYALDGDDIIGEMEFQGGNEFDLFIMAETPTLPERSPLHPEALNLADLELGLVIQLHNIHARKPGKIGVINGEPFFHGEKSQDALGYLETAPMVPVVTTDYCGRLVHEDWFLRDMGVVPLDWPEEERWNEQNYTLAVQ